MKTVSVIPADIADVLRWTILAQAVFVCLISTVIFAWYIGLALRTRRDPLPWHVASISLSYLGATVFIALEMINRFGDPMTYRVPFAGAIFVLGDFSLIMMLTHLYSQRSYAPKLRQRMQTKLDKQ